MTTNATSTYNEVYPPINVDDLKPGVDLSWGTLRDTEIWFANIAGAKLFGARIWDVLAHGLEAQGANLECSRLYDIKAHGIDLSSANLTEARVRDCDFSEAKAVGVCLKEAPIVENVNFSDADLRGADLRGAQFFDCDFTNADLRGADLRSAKFTRCRFANANLGSVDCSEWDDEQIWETRPGTEFDRCDLAGANWAGADITDAQFKECAPDEGAFRHAIDRNRRRRRR